MKLSMIFFMLLGMIFSACALSKPGVTTNPTPNAATTPSPTNCQATLVLTHGNLIDGTGRDPAIDSTLVIDGDQIIAIGPAAEVSIPAGVEVIDLEGAYLLPGFINAHVHDAYDENRLEAWAQAGVTTVRDEGILSGTGQLTQLMDLRNRLAVSPKYARLVASGYMLSVPGGYGQLDVTSVEDARQQVTTELDAGVDLIKLAMESGYAGVTNLPNFSPPELQAIVTTAHAGGRLVSAHITQAKFLQMLLDAGVDDLAHIPNDFVQEAMISQLVKQDVYVVPTLTVFEAYGGLQGSSDNLKKFVKAGIQIAMGNDYTAIPQNNFDHFDLGMPMHEIIRMSEAGMTAMQIIVASTRNAAHVCGLEKKLGALEVGKLADILILDADPLQDLSALTQVKMVIHSGEIILR
jgi:imidazolonepropionase-like amidohydrolase